MTKNSQYQPLKQEITPDKGDGNRRTLNNKKHPYPLIIAYFIEKVKHKINKSPVESPKIIAKLTQKFQPKPLEPGLKMPKNYELRAIKLTTLALTTFLVTLLSAPILAPVQTSRAETLGEKSAGQVQALVQGSAYYLTVSSSGAKLQLNSTPDSAITAGSDTVMVKTNAPSGYKLYLSTATSGEDANKLFLDGNAANNSRTNSISPTTGKFDNPVALSNNTWGFALTKSDAEPILAAQSLTPVTNFSESYSTETTDPDSTWTAVPTKENSQLVKVTSTPDENDNPTENNSLTVYYGVKATTEIQSGTYKNTVLYTAISEDVAQDKITLNPAELETNAPDKSIDITTSLVTNVSNLDTSTITATIGGTSCPITAVTNNATTGAVVVTCTAPDLGVGTYTVVVNIPDYGKTYTLEDGFTWATPTKYNLTITFAGSGVSSVQVRTAAGTGGDLIGTVTASGGNVSDLTNNETYYLYPTFSNGYSLGSWAKTGSAGTINTASSPNPTFTIGTGNNAVTITGTASLYSLANNTNLQALTVATCKSAGIDTDTTQVTTMTDSRDNNTYTVAKLADGNCWLTQNLRLGATPGALTTAKAFTLTSSNSNVSSSFSVATSDMASSGSTSWGDPYDAKHIYLTGNETYGNYYNWYTATAGTGTQNGITSNDDAPASICPSSGTHNTPWKLPPSSDNSSYITMFQSSGIITNSTTSATNVTVISAMQATPYSFYLSGWYSNRAYVNGSAGRLWSRTASGTTNARSIYYTDGGFFNFQNGDYKYVGSAVRCVLVTSE